MITGSRPPSQPPDGDGADEVAVSFAAHLTELHRTLEPKEQAILEQLFLRSLDPLTRRQVAGQAPFSDDELAILAELEGLEP